MLTAFLALSGLALLDVSVSSGYYSLNELASSLSRQGISIQASSDCANDLYVLRAERMPWLELRDALQADGRLVLTARDNRWTIGRATGDRAQNEAAARRYLGQLAESIHQVYTGAANESASYILGSEEVRDRDQKKISETKGKDSLKAAKDQLVYLCAMSSGMMFHELGAPAYVSSFRTNTETFGRVRLSTVAQIPRAFVPAGDFSKSSFARSFGTSDADIERFLNSVVLGGKLNLEPVSDITTFRLITYLVAPFNGELDIAEAKPITPQRFKATPTLEKLWGKEDLASKQARVAATSGIFPAATPVPSEHPVRLSEALLRWAEKTKASLICHVSPMTDYVVSGENASDPRVMVASVNKGEVDQGWLSTLVSERAVPANQYRIAGGIAPAPRLSANRSGRLFVFRGEYGYLDALNPLREGPPSSFFNLLHTNKKPALSDLTRHIAGIKIQNLRNSQFPSTYLEFCNPYALRPFALAMEKSPKFKSAILAIEPGKSLKIPTTELDAAASAALGAGLVECAELNDAISGIPDPVMSLRHIQNTKEPITLEVTRTATQYEFSLREGYHLWRAWAKNVDSN